MNGFDTFQGLPLHVLVIHAVVAGVPLAAIVTTAVAARPRWAARAGWWVLALDVLVYAATLVAKESGERLFARLSEPQVALAHTRLGDAMPWYSLAIVVVALLVVVCHRGRQVSRWLAAGLAVLTFAVAVVAVTQVVRVGHSGATAVWGQTVRATKPG